MKTTFRPILFSTPMVLAILEDRKTQTRRTKGLEKINENPDNWKFDRYAVDMAFNKIGIIFSNDNEEIHIPFKANIGDVFWVRETFEYFESNYNPHGNPLDKNSTVKIQFKADRKVSEEFPIEGIKALKAFAEIQNLKSIFKPSIFMPKPACRIFLKIKNIRVERLQEISEKDAIAEGIIEILPQAYPQYREWKNYLNPYNPHGYKSHYNNPINSFCSLWHSINGKGSWNANPFVWVYELEKIEKPNDFV